MQSKRKNPAVYFEIPVEDMQRAIHFYHTLFSFTFEREQLDGYEMAFFPLDEQLPGITGALAQGDVYIPSKNGAILYFHVDDIDDSLNKAKELKAEILYPKTLNTAYGFAVTEIADSEGNRIALKQSLRD
ncbi:VOC family protein [Sphingobacterium bambusae]|uniref:VOC family protein n=1 Tax=Sphingobacterium bambusae TaxID=662858 RepID=A0ABW6BAX8_9SPHI|nr:VOC family protein [Sphingobacterium bambusae]WPL49164.1 VOC family protein [Sphingobacterium bambusae]